MTSSTFTLPLGVDLAAVYLMGITGVVEAIKREFDLVGVFAMAFLVGLGGALIRDGIFLQDGPPALVLNQAYLLAVTAAAVTGLVFGRRVIVSERLIAWVDALALGAYAVVGADKSLSAGLPFVSAVLIGTINACGGGVLRDLIARESPLVFKPGQFYALAAMGGAIFFCGLRESQAVPPMVAALGGIFFTFVFRVLAIVRNWHTQPLGESGLFWRRKAQERKRRSEPPRV